MQVALRFRAVLNVRLTLGSIYGHLSISKHCRLLAREGLNAEQLARDLKSFELKVIILLRSILSKTSSLNTFEALCMLHFITLPVLNSQEIVVSKKYVVN